MKQIEALGLHWIAVGGYERWIEVAELMPDVYRVIWLSDVDIVSCSSDPRCIAKEHYNPPVGSPDLSFGVTDEERGVIPLYALTAVDYVSSSSLHFDRADVRSGEPAHAISPTTSTGGA